MSLVGSLVVTGVGSESTEAIGAGPGDVGREDCRFRSRLVDFLSLDLDGVDGVDGSVCLFEDNEVWPTDSSDGAGGDL